MQHKTLIKVAFRSIFLEASWNHKGQQSLGYAAAIEPALNEIYQTQPKEILLKAKKRSLEFFNTNPLTIGLSLGVAIKLEENIAQKKINEPEAKRILKAVATTLAALGDNLFWYNLVPLICLISILLAIIFMNFTFLIAPPIIFIIISLFLRLGGVFYGYKYSSNIFCFIEKLKLPFIIDKINNFLAVLLGFATVILLHNAYINTNLKHFSISTVWLMSIIFLILALVLRAILKKIINFEYIFFPLLIIGFSTIFYFIDQYFFK